MKATTLYRPGAHQAHQTRWCSAMAEGLRHHGITVQEIQPGDTVRGDFGVCWGWRARQSLPQMPVLVLECGYAGNRLEWASAGWNGLNGRARFSSVDDGGIRWRSYFPDVLKPKRRGNAYVLLIGQVRGDASIADVDIDAWYGRIIGEMPEAPMVFRPHPLDGDHRRWPALPILQGELEDALSGASLVVTFNSNTGVVSALAGLPTRADDEGSMIWPLMAPDADRQKWAHRLAWCQWRIDELRDGTAWDYLRDREACTRISA